MSKEIYISSTPHETRLAIVEKDELSEIYYERENEYTLAGSIYNGRVTRVLPGMQSSFVDIGLERDAFLYITDFMEEQGDSADFEGGSARPEGEPRRGDRGERNAGRSTSRDAERGERPRREARPGESANADDAVQTETGAASISRPDFTDVGEGAPGADGSRRWRGRRGRRRGRDEEESRTAAAADGVVSDDAFEAQPLPGDEYRAEAAAREELGAEPSFTTGGGRSERPREGRRDRGDRGGRGDREGRGGRSSGRDHASGGGGYGADQSLELNAGAEPFVLPGESLARYGKGSPAASGSGNNTSPLAARNQPVVLARPSTEIDISAWDGGSILPGETLRARGNADRGRQTPGQPSSTPEPHAGDTPADGGSRRRDRDARRGRRPAGAESGTRSFAPPAALDPAEAVLPGVTSQHEPDPSPVPLSDDAPQLQMAEIMDGEMRQEFEAVKAETLDIPYEPQTDVAPPAAAETSGAVLEAVEEFHETVSEYEPGNDASASYRIDPAPPSEFRQSLVEDELTMVESRFAENHGAAASTDEFTAVQPSGEMISEFPLVPEAEAQASLGAQLASPIHHEGAVLSVHAPEAEHTPEPITAGPGEATSPEPLLQAENPQVFAPGDGALEEEVLDDEDGEPLTLSAAAHGYDDTEEETLEGAADLGVMLRDMSIDEITRPEHVGDEDEDFDLDIDDLEEDELDSSSEFGDADAEPTDEVDAGELAETGAFEEEGDEGSSEVNLEAPRAEMAGGQETARPARRDRGRRDRAGRDRAGRDPGRDHGGDRDSRRNGSRAGGRSDGRMSRHVAQTSNLPAISDLLKPGQELLVQIAKEPIAKKGARITSHIALPGRFLVFMPTVNHVGVSRKIESDGERRRLKEILLSEKGEASGGFIVRTAASGASEEELRSDLRFLLNLWADIKQRSESSKSPALIYHDLNLVERVLRDQVTDNFSAIWVDTEAEYERVLRFLQRFQPSLIRRVKLYTKDTPLFDQFGIAEEINKALRSKVWLKSGGSIVINQTEALVAIDINTGKYVGKTARLEDTIVKTNLDAIPEIVRQIRLRDLGGIIVIDFIDMDDRKNRHRVLAALEEELKKDRAPSKVLQFNDFGLVAITRKRVKQSLERTLSTTCSVCAGTGMTKSPITVCNEIYIELRKMHRNLEKGDIMLRVNPEVVKQLKSNNARWLQDLEELAGKTLLVKSDPTLHPEQFDIH